MSPDLSDMWHQRPPVGPQWEGGLELNFDNNSEGRTTMRLAADTTKLVVLLRKVQRITSVTCARAHCGSRFVSALLQPMFWSCLWLGQSGTMRNCMENLQNDGSSS